MKITFLGAAGTVTGSKTLLEAGEDAVMVDCGMYQGKGLGKLNADELALDPRKLSAIFLTHGHFDHCGYLPVLVKRGFRGKIISTAATKEVVQVILEDSSSIQEFESKKEGAQPPLYDLFDVERTMELFSTRDLNERHEEKGFFYRFHEAGHILGAASLEIEREGKRICFSGDLGRKDDLIHLPPALPSNADVLILESTYGDRLHPGADPMEEMAKHVERIKKTKGVLLIPSFAVARSQVVVHLLRRLFDNREELRLPVYFDSPMGLRTTRLYEKYAELLKVSKKQFKESLKNVKFMEFGKDQKKLARIKGPYILLASSGMVSGGRVLKHFDMIAKHEENTVLLVGYQGEGTIGKSLLEGAKEVPLFGHMVKVRAMIGEMESLSAHADHVEMTELIESCQTKPNKIFLNHGERESLESFQNFLTTRFGCEVEIARKNVEYDIS